MQGDAIGLLTPVAQRHDILSRKAFICALCLAYQNLANSTTTKTEAMIDGTVFMHEFYSSHIRRGFFVLLVKAVGACEGLDTPAE